MWDKVKEQWNENPVSVIAVGGFAITAIAKFVDAVSAAKGRKAYARQVDYRIRGKK